MTNRPQPIFKPRLPSLPHLLKTTLEIIPAPIPYIHAPPPSDFPLRRDNRARAELKVGLVWAGNREHLRDRDRSLALSALAPILAIEGVRFFSLQVGAATHEASPAVTDISPELTDFAQTAGAIANLDLVISVDTAVAHRRAHGQARLRPLPLVPDWRWLLEREDSPWYPTARLFRQRARGDWEPVMREIAEGLAMLAQAAAARHALRLRLHKQAVSEGRG